MLGRGRHRHQRVQHIVAAHQRQSRGLAETRPHDVELRAQQPAHHQVLRAVVAGMLDAEQRDLPVKVAAELGDVSIVGVEKCMAAGRQRFDQFVLGARDAGLRAEALQMRHADVGHHAHVGRGNSRQGGDLARMIHAHLDHRKLMLRLQTQQLQRKPPVVVQISQRLQHVELPGHHVRNAFLGGGLPRRAGHRNQLSAPKPPRRRAQPLQGQRGVVHHDQPPMVVKAGEAAGGNDGCYRSLLQSGLYKSMSVQALALDGEKQLARPQRPRVDRIALGRRRVIEPSARLDEFRDPAQREPHACPPPRPYPMRCSSSLATR